MPLLAAKAVLLCLLKYASICVYGPARVFYGAITDGALRK